MVHGLKDSPVYRYIHIKRVQTSAMFLPQLHGLAFDNVSVLLGYLSENKNKNRCMSQIILTEIILKAQMMKRLTHLFGRPKSLSVLNWWMESARSNECRREFGIGNVRNVNFFNPTFFKTSLLSASLLFGVVSLTARVRLSWAKIPAWNGSYGVIRSTSYPIFRTSGPKNQVSMRINKFVKIIDLAKTPQHRL